MSIMFGFHVEEFVLQQARVIEESTTFKVGTFCGSSKPLKTHHEWEKEIDQYEVIMLII